MGNNNATANLTEEESTKVETNGMSPLESVPVETTQDQVFLVGEGKDGDKQRDSFSDGVTGKETPETEPQSKELDKDPQVTKVEEDMSHDGLVMATDEQLHKNTAVGEGVETVCVSTKVEELSMTGTQSVEKKLNAEEYVNEDKSFVCDEIVFVSPGLNETAGTEENLVVNESLEETANHDQEICMEQGRVLPEIEPQEILNLENHVLDDDATNEGKGDQEIPKPFSQGSNAIVETGFEDYKEERDMELAREASLKRMSRCRSLPVSNNSRVKGDSPVQELVSEVAYPSRHKTGFVKAKTCDILPVSCRISNKVQETTEAITESSKEAKIEMRSPSFSDDLRIQERSDEPTEEAPLLSQDKTETYKATLDVEEETVMLKRSETEKIRGFELSLGLSMNLSKRCDADDSFEETKSAGDNLLDEKSNMSETQLVSCVGSKKAHDINEVIIESNTSTEETPLLSQDKTETHKATLDVEEETVMLTRSETEKIRGFELSLGLSMNLSGRCGRDDSFKQTKGSGDNLADKKANTSETLFVSCVGNSKAKEATKVITESNKEYLLEMRSPSSGNVVRAKERSCESTGHIPLLCQEETETYDATIDVEKKPVMLKRSESKKTRGFELTLGLSMKPGERSEADDGLKENNDSGENLLDKKASWGSMKGRVRKRSKSSLFGTCLCCNTAMN